MNIQTIKREIQKFREDYKYTIFSVLMLLFLFGAHYTIVNVSHNVYDEQMSLELELKEKENKILKEKMLLLEQSIEPLKEEIKTYEKLKRLKDDLTKVDEKNWSMVLSLAYTESTFRYKVTHPTDPHDTIGIGGIKKSIWGKRLKERNIDINSLRAIEFVWETYLEENSFKKLNALASYKGAITNFKTVNRTLSIEQKILEHI